jgi:ankyrin repeat protein
VRERLRARRYADIPDARGRSSLILAAGYGNLGVVSLLHEAHNADLALQDHSGDTALNYAIDRGFVPVPGTRGNRAAVGLLIASCARSHARVARS